MVMVTGLESGTLLRSNTVYTKTMVTGPAFYLRFWVDEPVILVSQDAKKDKTDITQ
jgi:hypothetical protein